MKTNVIMKIAVVFLAAFGAYAFSGNNANEQTYKRSDTCQNITAECNPTGTANCMIQIGRDKFSVLDTDCALEIKHINSDPVQWKLSN